MLTLHLNYIQVFSAIKTQSQACIQPLKKCMIIKKNQFCYLKCYSCLPVKNHLTLDQINVYLLFLLRTPFEFNFLNFVFVLAVILTLIYSAPRTHLINHNSTPLKSIALSCLAVVIRFHRRWRSLNLQRLITFRRRKVDIFTKQISNIFKIKNSSEFSVPLFSAEYDHVKRTRRVH